MPIEVDAVVHLAIDENVQQFLESKKKKEVQNPLLRIIHDLLDDAVLDSTKEIVEEVITEKVDDHLMSMRCRVAFHSLLGEIIDGIIHDDFTEMYQDVDVDVTRESILNECIDEIIGSFVNDIVDEIQDDLKEAQLASERKAIESSLMDVFVARQMMIYFMHSISENFHTVQFEYHAMKIVERMVATHLVSIIDEIENEMGGTVNNEVIKYIVSKFYHTIMQESLLTDLQNLSVDLLEDIDRVEQRQLAKEYQKEGRDPRLAYEEPSFPSDFTEIPRMHNPPSIPDIIDSSSSSSATSSTGSLPFKINFQSL